MSKASAADQLVPSRETEYSRRLRQLRRLASDLSQSSYSSLEICRKIISGNYPSKRCAAFFEYLGRDERHFWISSLYAFLISPKKRKQLAAFFTPPHIVAHMIRLLTSEGIRINDHKILDPASGGAAFLVPLLAIAIGSGVEHKKGMRLNMGRLEGVEIDPGLANLSKILIDDVMRSSGVTAGKKEAPKVHRANSLNIGIKASSFDAVIGNPPYGRIFKPSSKIKTEFSSVITKGYVNRYSLFTKLSVSKVKPGGTVCLLIPMSFISGPGYKSLREFLLSNTEIKRIDLLEKRTSLFFDVSCDLCIVLMKKRSTPLSPGETHSTSTECYSLRGENAATLLGLIEYPSTVSGRHWVLPDALNSPNISDGLETLEDYGYQVKTGYFVWNREKKRYRRAIRPKKNEVPLIWSHNICANKICKPFDRKERHLVGYVSISPDSPAIVRTDALVLQRTTNRRQKRMLIAGVVRKKTLPSSHGFVSENHTIVVIPAKGKVQKLSLSKLSKLINTEAVDSQLRRISGTASITASALRNLPLPNAETYSSLLQLSKDPNYAAEMSYIQPPEYSTCQGGRAFDDRK